MADIAKLAVVLGGSAAGFSSMMSGAGRSLDGFRGKLSGTERALASFKSFALTAMGAIGAANLFREWGQEEQAIAKLQSVLAATGGAAGVTSEQVLGLADSLQKTTTFADDMTIAAAGVLATFTNIKGDTFNETIKLAQDLSTVMGTDLTASAKLLGKALDNPAEGLSRLARVGVSFSESQKSQIEAMQAAGNVAGAQRIILDELRATVGGAAEAIGNTFSGQVTIAWNAVKNLGDTIAESAAPAVKVLAEALAGVADFAAKNEGLFTALAIAVGGAVISMVAYVGIVKGAAIAMRMWATAKALVLALEGPAGWAILLGASAAFLGAVMWIGNAYDEAASKAQQSAPKQLAGLKSVEDGAKQAASAVGSIGEQWKKVQDSMKRGSDDIKKQIDKIKAEVATFGMSDVEKRADAMRRMVVSMWQGTPGGELLRSEFRRLIPESDIQNLELWQAKLDRLKAAAKEWESLRDARDSYLLAIETPLEKWEKQSREIETLFNYGMLNAEQRARAIGKITEEYGRATRSSEDASRAKIDMKTDRSIPLLERRFTLGFRDKGDRNTRLLERNALAAEKTAANTTGLVVPTIIPVTIGF